MGNGLNDFSKTEKNAQRALNSILQSGDGSTGGATTPKVSVAEARQEPVYVPQTGREAVRVLFIATDTTLLTQATTSLDGFTAISDVFDEVHVLVLRTGLPPKNPVLRVAYNTWLYTATAKHAWELPFAGWRLLNEQLVFADGFRPDLIVARDTYESAVTAYGAGKFYGRPTQLHIPHERMPAASRLRRWLRCHMPNRFPSLRVETQEDLDHAMAQFTHCHDISVLPRFRNYVREFTGEKQSYLTDKYKQFNFVILFVGDFYTTQSAFLVIDALRGVLRNPRVGLVMVGDGPGSADCMRRAEILGVSDQVVIERRADNLRNYIASADVMVVVDETLTADEIVLSGAAAGAPMVVVETPLRRDLFDIPDAALLVPAKNPNRIADGVTKILNDNALRHQMRAFSRDVAERRLQSDPTAFEAAYRDSIERAIIASDDVLA